MKGALKDGARAVTTAIRTEANTLKTQQRRKIQTSGGSKRLANTVRADVYPKTAVSLGAAANIYTKAPHILESWEHGSVIRANKTRYLALPTENAPKKGKDRKKITPKNFPEARYGKLRPVRTKRGHILLVADNVTARKRRETGAVIGFKKASNRALKTGNGLSTVVMFILVPQVKMRKRLTFMQDGAAAQARLPQRILRNWKDT